MKRAIIYGTGTVLLGFLLILMVVALKRPAPADPPTEPKEPTAEDVNVRVPQPEEPVRTPPEPPEPWDLQTTLLLKDGEQIQEITVQEYLLGVLCSEMPISFEPEALKAQVVASRTFALARKQRGTAHTDCDVCSSYACCQAWSSTQTLQERFADGWEQAREKALDAIEQTNGEVLVWEDRLISAVFFSCSGGLTESAAAVWGGEVSYLQPVQSPGEEISKSYIAEQEIPLEEFQRVLLEESPEADLSGNPSGWFGAVERTDGDGVAQMEIGGVSFTGTRLRSLFGLNSTRFTVGITQDAILFQTMGKGHRVGMSQYGAQAMALEGRSYSEILLHYYTGVSLAQGGDYVE